jgi:hypothetical protein
MPRPKARSWLPASAIAPVKLSADEESSLLHCLGLDSRGATAVEAIQACAFVAALWPPLYQTVAAAPTPGQQHAALRGLAARNLAALDARPGGHRSR